MLEVRDIHLLRRMLIRYEQLILHPHFHELSCLDLSTCTDYSSHIQLLKLSAFPTSNTPEYFSFVLTALGHLDEVIGLILSYDETGYAFYIGICNQDENTPNIPSALAVLKAGLKQTFPELTLTVIRDSASFLAEFFNPEECSLIAHTLAIPPASSSSTRAASSLSKASNAKKTATSSTLASQTLMGRFLELMGNSSSYTALFLAKPISKHNLYGLLDEYYELSQTLSQFTQSTHNHSTSLAKNTSKTITTGHTEANAHTNSESRGNNTSCNQGGYTNTSGSTPISYCEDKSVNVTVLQNFAKATVNAENCSVSNSCCCTKTDSSSEARLSATNKNDNEGLSFSIQNRYVMNALDHINQEITRVHALIDTACFAFNSYFFSPASETALLAAYNFAGLCQTNNNASSFNAVNYWTHTNAYFNELMLQLQHFHTPTFCHENQEVSPGLLIQSTELNSCFYR